MVYLFGAAKVFKNEVYTNQKVKSKTVSSEASHRITIMTSSVQLNPDISPA